MSIVVVVNSRKEWPFKVRGIDVVEARSYLTKPEFGTLSGVRLFNLCRSYKYQSLGYYVTLMATARGHRPLPDLTTIQDLKLKTMVRFVSDELDDLIQHSLRPIRSQTFQLSIYFGHNLAKCYDRLSGNLFNLVQAPFLHATFARPKGNWILRSIQPIPVGDIPGGHREFALQKAREYFSGKRISIRKKRTTKYDLAILANSEEPEPPSNPAAIDQFLSAAQDKGLAAEVISRDDFPRLAEFDALFIRETTHVNHHTYRFARRAARNGLVVMDDPESILKCTNKAYLAELLARKKIPIPRTMIVHRDNVESVGAVLGFPCILKLPDAAFSLGVVKIDDEDSLRKKAEEFLGQSELLVAQEFLPTSFDWRVGICNKEPLFVCKYHMASQHWQIIKRNKAGHRECGQVENVQLRHVPRGVMQTALDATRLIGDGFYGVDLKQVNGRACVIEINDNPNVDAGNEDQLLKAELYRRIMDIFVTRIERRKAEVDST
jgi:glutathione synthase/RimK-type ligase-like ATP-grasp enzyme